MRISDWSSDVCSSDLQPDAGRSRVAWALAAVLTGAGHGPGRCALHVLYEPVERPERETGQAVDPARREAAEQGAEAAEPADLESRHLPKPDVAHWAGIPYLGATSNLEARPTKQRHAEEDS